MRHRNTHHISATTSIKLVLMHWYHNLCKLKHAQTWPSHMAPSKLHNKIIPGNLQPHLLFKCHLLSSNTWPFLHVFPSGQVQVYLWMLQSGNIVLFNIQVFWHGKYSYSLLISWKLSFPTVGLKIPSLWNILTKFSRHTLGIDQIYSPVPHGSCLSYHHFYP
jgi:hypothetical protein